MQFERVTFDPIASDDAIQAFNGSLVPGYFDSFFVSLIQLRYFANMSMEQWQAEDNRLYYQTNRTWVYGPFETVTVTENDCSIQENAAVTTTLGNHAFLFGLSAIMSFAVFAYENTGTGGIES